MNNFIKVRLNKDNFWNTMFFLMFFVGLAFGFIIPQPFGGIMFWLSIVGAILLVKRNSHLTFDKEKLEFITSQGTKIQKAGLMFIWLIIISFFLSAGIVGFIAEWVNAANLLLEQILFAFFFTFLPSLYCILRNFPIAIYFKKEAWTTDDTKESYNSNSYWRNNPHHASSMNSYTQQESMLTSPRYAGLSCNTYHRK